MSAKPNVVYVQKQQNHGCLMGAVVFLLFGWIGLAAMAAWKMTKLAWSWTVAVGWKLPVALTKATWKASVVATVACTTWTVRGTQAVVARVKAARTH